MLADCDLKELMRSHYLAYASYVILDRAIPDVVDGLKPVQRRILHTLFKLHDGKLHKVANVAGQTMAYHPHGDAPITDALINLANKGYLLGTQGNFGNIYTGDPAAASRYIETRLSEFAIQTMFNPDLTEFLPSYDGRNKEPKTLPAKVPLLLMQGAEGIAVGMSTRILPHNFKELLEAQIAILEKKPFELLPDFVTGGVMDASEYDKGRGKVKLRASLVIKDPKTIVIQEICHGTTTESVVRSVDEAAKKGKIKIDSIHDYTSEKVEIEIKLPRGVYAEETIDQLYAFTDCEVSLSSQVVVIKEGFPWETDVDEILKFSTARLQEYLKRELELERERLQEKIFEKTLEEIFIENRLYKKIEEIKSYEKIHETVANSLKPFHKRLIRVPTYDDREKLLSLPIRRISRFNLEKNQEEIVALDEALQAVEKNLKSVKRYTVNYLKALLKKYGKDHPRRTRLREIETIDRRAISTKELTVGVDAKQGFVGTKVKSDLKFTLTNFDKILVLFSDGTYKVMNIPEKEFLNIDGKKVVYVGIADKETVFNAVYLDPKARLSYAKSFVVKKFILDKEYRFFEPKMKLEFLSTDEVPQVNLKLVPIPKQKVKEVLFSFEDVLIKSVSAKGIKMTPRAVKKVVSKSKEDFVFV